MVAALEDAVTTPDRRERYLASGLWDQTRLTDRLVLHAREQPDATAVVDRSGERRRSFAEVLEDAQKVAAFLHRLGVESGDVVSMQLPSSYEFVVSFCGALLAGAVVNPLLPNYRRQELTHILETSGSKVLFTPASYREFDHAELAGQLRAEVTALATHVLVDSRDDRGDHRLRDVLAGAAPSPENLRSLPERPADAVTELIFTSGTEAAPKAIMHTEQTTNFSVRTGYTSLGMSPDDVVWMPSPLGHSTGLNYGARFALYHGLKLVLQDRWSASAAAGLIEREGCSYTLAATTFLHDLVAVARRGDHDLSSMRLFGCGGAPVPAELVAEAEQHGITVLRLYGSTEVLVATWNRPWSPAEKRQETDGVAVDDVEVELWDENDVAVSPGQEGEIHTRGPNTCVGFFADPERTRANFTDDGWVRSGDLAVMDADGYLAVMGRKKEIIIRGGMNITPREIEDVLLQLEAVDQTAIVGLPEERMGETVCAFVVPSPGAEVTLEAVTRHLEEHGLARYKLPERLLIVDELPRTASGKIQKFALVEQATAGAGGGAS